MTETTDRALREVEAELLALEYLVDTKPAQVAPLADAMNARAGTLADGLGPLVASRFAARAK